jgi:uncharacterized membrane protein
MDKRLYQISIALTILGLAVSIYMTVYKIIGDSRLCLGNGGCDVVNKSIYAEINGFPVAGVGVLGYLAIIGVLVLEQRGSKFFKNNAVLMNFGLTLIGFAFTLYLVYVELALIKALCPFCVTSQVTMTILFVITLIRLIKQFNE